MYQIIDDKQEQKIFDTNKITPEVLGLKPTTDLKIMPIG